MYLPAKVREAFKPYGGGQEPRQAAHALNSLSGSLGDTYLLAAADGIMLYTSQIGQESQALFLRTGEIVALELRDDRPFVFLSLRVGSQDYQLKFAAMDREPLAAVVQQWQDAGRGVPPPPDASPPPAPAPAGAGALPPPVALTPMVGFCAAAYALIQADGNVAPAEVEALARAVASPDAMARGLEYLRQQGPATLFAELRDRLTRDQKLCLLANLLDLSMTDNAVRSTEKRLLQEYCTALDVAPNDYAAVFEVLLLQHSVGLFPDA